MNARLVCCLLGFTLVACTTVREKRATVPWRSDQGGFQTVVVENNWHTVAESFAEGPVRRFDTVVSADAEPCGNKCSHYVATAIRYRSADDAPTLESVIDQMLERLRAVRVGELKRSAKTLYGLDAVELAGVYAGSRLSFVGRYVRVDDRLMQALVVFPTDSPPESIETFFSSLGLVSSSPPTEALR